MTGLSHGIVGGSSVLILLSVSGIQDISVASAAVLTGVIGSLIPDVDAKNSVLQHHIFHYGTAFWTDTFISKRFRRSITGSIFYSLIAIVEITIRIVLYAPIMVLKLFVVHRGITHTIVAATILTLIFIVVSIFFHLSIWIAISFSIGYVSHIVLDGVTQSGITPFIPVSKKQIHLLPLRNRITTGSSREYVVLIGWCIVWLFFFFLLQRR